MGKNDPPASHLAAGLVAAGDVPTTGAVWTTLGMSTTVHISEALRGIANSVAVLTDPLLAASTLTVEDWDESTDAGWARLTTLANAGYPAESIAVVWVLLVKGTAATPRSPTLADMEAVLTQIGTLLPNCKQVFLSSYPYGGYKSGAEPHMWESGRVIRELIQNHLGETDPWLGWGPYLWANGANPREDGLTWETADYVNGGTDIHLSDPTGRVKAANLLEDFFQNSVLTPWYRV